MIRDLVKQSDTFTVLPSSSFPSHMAVYSETYQRENLDQMENCLRWKYRVKANEKLPQINGNGLSVTENLLFSVNIIVLCYMLLEFT